MEQDEVGNFHFHGVEHDVAMRWLWVVLLDTSFWGRVELTLRIWFKRPPKWIFKKGGDGME